MSSLSLSEWKCKRIRPVQRTAWSTTKALRKSVEIERRFLRALFSESYRCEPESLAEPFWVEDSSSVNEKAKGEVVNVGNPQEITIPKLQRKLKN